MSQTGTQLERRITPTGRRQASTGAAVVCRGVTKTFGDGETQVHALRGVDLEAPYGEMSLLVGPSGCGKTTLLSVLAGILEPTDGSVTVLGQPLNELRGQELVRFRGQNIGFIFQQYNLLPALTAAENAAIPLLIQGWPRRKAVARAKELLDAVGVGARAHALPSQLSGGQQQRVAIARALVHEPRLIICDEPTSALDGDTGHVIMEIIRRVGVGPDRAVIVVTHDNRVFEFGDRIIHMNDGRIVRTETNGLGETKGSVDTTPVSETLIEEAKQSRGSLS
ncbi:MAG: ABC transporter ATP-binding protein [Gemmatales bacterium]|nr:ABC transporter ATP-binding protein [Gemmatales bacterium]MDW8386342.1 ABC transporter ATP-binding protein [Gemmatales bacterium]